MKAKASKLWHLPLLLVASTMLMPLAFMIVTALSSRETSMRAEDSFLLMLWPKEWARDIRRRLWGSFLYLSERPILKSRPLPTCSVRRPFAPDSTHTARFAHPTPVMSVGSITRR